MSFNQLKVEDIEAIYKKIYSNACELIEDAELLYEHQRYARSYLSAQIAFEELGKLPMLFTAALKLYNGSKVDWRDLSSRLRNHKTKNSSSFAIAMMFSRAFTMIEGKDGEDKTEEEYDIPRDLETFKELLNENVYAIDIIEIFRGFKEGDLKQDYLIRKALSEYLNDLKNHSLYADFKDGQFLKPSEVIDEEKCRKRLKTVLLQQKFAEITIQKQGGFKLFKYENAHYYNALREIIDERMKEFT